MPPMHVQTDLHVPTVGAALLADVLNLNGKDVKAEKVPIASDLPVDLRAVAGGYEPHLYHQKRLLIREKRLQAFDTQGGGGAVSDTEGVFFRTDRSPVRLTRKDRRFLWRDESGQVYDVTLKSEPTAVLRK